MISQVAETMAVGSGSGDIRKWGGGHDIWTTEMETSDSIPKIATAAEFLNYIFGYFFFYNGTVVICTCQKYMHKIKATLRFLLWAP